MRVATSMTIENQIHPRRVQSLLRERPLRVLYAQSTDDGAMERWTSKMKRMCEQRKDIVYLQNSLRITDTVTKAAQWPVNVQRYRSSLLSDNSATFMHRALCGQHCDPYLKRTSSDVIG